MANPFLEQPKSTASVGSGAIFIDLLQSVVVALFIVIVVYLFIVIPNQVSGPSMQPNFFNAELVLTSKVNQWLGNTDFGKDLGLAYQRGDVVVFQKPGKQDLIKRVIGLPGESVMVLDCEVYVNDKLIEEAYIPTDFCTNPGTLATEGRKIELAPGEYFVMGDNRGNSLDSRFVDYGPIKREWVKGKVVLRYLPLNRFTTIGSGKITFEE